MRIKAPFHKILLGVSIVLLSIAVQVEPVEAATWLVDTAVDEQDGSCADDDCSLRDAILVAAPGDTVAFATTLSGQTILLTSGQVDVDKSLTITAAGLDFPVRISGNHTNRVLWVHPGAVVTLSGLAIVDGDSGDTFGGAGILNEGTLTVAGCSITGNTTPDNGGGIHNYATMTISGGASVSGNSAGYGGGIRNDNDGSLTIVDTTISDNLAAFGGGIDNYSGSMSMTISSLERNTATYYGGAITTSAAATIEGSTFRDNSAQSGGGVDNHGLGVNLILTLCTFTNNTASVNGGGMITDEGSVEVNSCTFDGNSAAIAGGGVFVGTTGTATINDSALTGNTASSLMGGYGGAIEVNGTLDLNRSTLSGNTALYNGGAIENWDGALTTSDCTFDTNDAATGGAVNNNSNGTATIRHSTFKGNTADIAGGAVYNDNNSTMTIDNSTLVANIASYEGGGVYNVSGEVTINNSTFDSNPAGSGGSINNHATLSFRNTIVASPWGNDCVNSGTIAENVNNLVTDGSCDAMLLGDAGLGPLQNNGGLTETCELLPDSPAIDAGDDMTCLAVDQRHYARPVDGGSGSVVCDVGAYEYGSTPLAALVANFAARPMGESISITWETVSEFDLAGFNLYRALSSDLEDRVLLAFVPAQSPGSSQGALYSYDDQTVPAGATYWYWLEAIDLDGATTLYGPVSATLQAPTAVTVAYLESATPAGAYRTAIPVGVAVLATLAMVVGLSLSQRRRVVCRPLRDRPGPIVPPN